MTLPLFVEAALGLHFTLTGGGAPAAAARGLPTLAPGGLLRRRSEDLPESLPAGEVLLELEAQIEIFQVLARKPPTHLDSHHHVALHPSVAPVFASVARRRSLPARASSDEARRSLRAAGVKTPDRFVDRFYGTGVIFETLESILEEILDGTTELMCHPGYPDAELKGSSTYVDEREWEIEVLSDARIHALVRARKISLAGFDAL